MRFCDLLTTIILWSSTVLADLYSDSGELMNHVLSDYDKRVRPYSDTGKPVIIDMTIVLAILTELRENQQVASVVLSHVQKWTDPKLAWNPKEFNNQRQLIIPESFIWVPKLFVYNSMDTKYMLTDNRHDVRVDYTGRVKMNIPQYVTCICRISIELFPFDTQFCAIAQASPLLNTDEMDVNATQPPKDSYFAGNAEWAAIDVSVRHMKFMEDGEYRAEVHYILHLKRRPIYYITVIVAPTFLISVLSILGIFSPGSNDGPRNEKVSLGLGSLLAMTVLLDIVAGAMPKSNSIPLLGYYIIAVIVLCAIAVCISMGFLALSRQFIQTEKLPSAFAYRLLWMQPNKKRMDFWETTEYLDGYEIDIPKFPDLLAIYTSLQEIVHAQQAFRKKLEKQQVQRAVEKEWNHVKRDHYVDRLQTIAVETGRSKMCNISVAKESSEAAAELAQLGDTQSVGDLRDDIARSRIPGVGHLVVSGGGTTASGCPSPPRHDSVESTGAVTTLACGWSYGSRVFQGDHCVNTDGQERPFAQLISERVNGQPAQSPLQKTLSLAGTP